MPALLSSLIGRLRPYKPSNRQAFRSGETLVLFVWRITGAHQFYIGLIAIAVALLNFVPIDLQKRIVDGPIMNREVNGLVALGGLYLAAVLLQAGLKYILLVYQGWISESAIAVCRSQLASVAADSAAEEATTSGQTANVVGAEIDRLCSFIGTSISEFVVNVTMLLAISAYMLYIQPTIAAFALAFLVPQAILATYLQAPLNVLVEKQIGLVRKLGDEVVAHASGDPHTSGNEFRTIWAIYRNRIRFYFLKYGLKTLLNLANAMGPLTVVVIGGYMVIEGTTTIGTVVAFVSGFERLSGPVRDLLNFYREAQQAKVQHQLILQWVESAEPR